MFEKNDKDRLYWLIEMYLAGKLSAKSFEDEFYYCYNIGGLKDLNDLEEQAFDELSTISSRVSTYEEDFIKCPNFFYTVKELHNQILKTKMTLKNESPLYKLLLEVQNELPPHDIEEIIGLVNKFEWAIAFETLCIQIFQNNIFISEEYYDKMLAFGNKVEVDPHICYLLKELIKVKTP